MTFSSWLDGRVLPDQVLRAKARGTGGVSAHTVTRVPREHGAFWGWLQDQDVPTLLSLMAVCVARVTNAGPRAWITPAGSQCIAAQVATAAGLGMRTCCTATKDSCLA